MHEMAIAEGILNIALETVAKYEAARVLSIGLEIGQMTEVEPESLRFCFSVLAAGSAAEGAVLEIREIPLVGHCISCRKDFGIEGFRFICPDCGSAGVEILSGRELRVGHLEVE